jgi:hypothetical protein
MVTVLVLLFLGADVGAVIIALHWLHERRIQSDRNDVRYRRRYR